jgi:aminopeptidase N
MPQSGRFLPLLAVLFSAKAIAATPVGPALPGRLPPEVVPVHYDMQVDPDAAKLSFTGSETIIVSVLRPTRTIVMNAAELTVGKALLDGNIAPVHVSFDTKIQTVSLEFAQPISAGTHRIALDFAGKINMSAAGLFAVDYKDGTSDKRMLVTQFEATDGRRFAPMWDEPGRKATFTISVATPAGQSSFSNMPIASTRPGPDGKSWVTFQTSPKMSSYLLFFGQGDVERRTRMVGKTEIGVITRRGVGDQGEYALDSAARLLTFYNDYFGTPYPLPKLDMVAAPGASQFFDAMENWGGILYFDKVLLVDPKATGESQRQLIFSDIAHEMAHQWFGDLVTMRWWDDLWLNEGFASWMASKATDALNPDWHVAAQTAAFAHQSGINDDARASTHPIVERITSVDQLDTAFDQITYSKGEAVIRMLEGAVGPDRFRAGIRSYMVDHAYGNTATDDLWAEISKAAGRPVKPMMDSFTLQPGVPLISVSEPACRDNALQLRFSQARYGIDAKSRTPLNWIVPVTWAGSGPGTGKAEADVSAGHPTVMSLPGCDTPPLINPGQLGYYRTLYSAPHFDALVARFAGLNLTDQVGLLADTLALGGGDYAPLERYYRLIGGVAPDADPLVWRVIAAELDGIDNVLEGDPAQAAFQARARALLAPQFARVGFAPHAGEPAAIAQLRETLIATLGELGDPQVVAAADQAVADGLDAIPAATRSAVLGVYGRNAGPQEWELLHQAAKAARNPLLARSYWIALANARDQALAQKALALVLGDEPTVPNRASMLRAVSLSHPEMAFDWAVAHADAVNQLIETSSRPGFIVSLATASGDLALVERVQAYADRALPANARQGAIKAITSIQNRAHMRKVEAGPAAAWAASH